MPDSCYLPPAGWHQPDRKGIVRFTMHGPMPIHQKPPKRDGFEVFFVGVHGNRFTTWSYRPVQS